MIFNKFKETARSKSPSVKLGHWLPRLPSNHLLPVANFCGANCASWQGENLFCSSTPWARNDWGGGGIAPKREKKVSTLDFPLTCQTAICCSMSLSALFDLTETNCRAPAKIG